MRKVLTWVRDELLGFILKASMAVGALLIAYILIVLISHLGSPTQMTVKVSANNKYTISSTLHVPLFDYNVTIDSDVDSVTAEKTIHKISNKDLKWFKSVSTTEYKLDFHK